MPQPERYYRAARFPDQPSSESPYLQLQELVFESDSDLSVFRFQLQDIWRIAVLGDHPGEDIDRRLEQIISYGEATELDSDILDYFFRYREESMIPGGWMEAHYTPGLRIPITRFELGRVVITRGVQAVLERHPEGRGVEALQSLILDRHAQGDWGDLGDEDKRLNDEALEHGDRLLSVYFLPDGTETGTKIYVITEADRSVTTALLPEEY